MISWGRECFGFRNYVYKSSNKDRSALICVCVWEQARAQAQG